MFDTQMKKNATLLEETPWDMYQTGKILVKVMFFSDDEPKIVGPQF